MREQTLEPHESDRLFRHAEKKRLHGQLARELLREIWNRAQSAGRQHDRRLPIQWFIPMNARAKADRKLSSSFLGMLGLLS